MTESKLRELFRDNTSTEKHTITASAIVNIGTFAKITIEMDRKTLDYYYQVSINELVKSNMPNEEYDVMKNQGWVIKDDKLILYV